MIAVSRAPIASLQAYKRRMGWTFTWASSLDSEFNYDFNTSFTEEQQRSGSVDYNYRALGTIPHIEEGSKEFATMSGTDVLTYTREAPGMSAFAFSGRAARNRRVRRCTDAARVAGRVGRSGSRCR